MVVSTDAFGNEVIFDPTKIVYATKRNSGIEITFNIMGSGEPTIFLAIEEWDKVKEVLRTISDNRHTKCIGSCGTKS